jgi:CTP synthase (UTP-ammonia lyase)
MKAMVYAHKVNIRENYASYFSALQKASTTLQCFVRLQVLWSHESENVSKQKEDTSKTLLES